ncbi:MAG: hypothetical protein R2848_05485 [Thermomicrobiales bacterium]
MADRRQEQCRDRADCLTRVKCGIARLDEWRTRFPMPELQGAPRQDAIVGLRFGKTLGGIASSEAISARIRSVHAVSPEDE